MLRSKGNREKIFVQPTKRGVDLPLFGFVFRKQISACVPLFENKWFCRETKRKRCCVGQLQIHVSGRAIPLASTPTNPRWFVSGRWSLGIALYRAKRRHHTDAGWDDSMVSPGIAGVNLPPVSRRGLASSLGRFFLSFYWLVGLLFRLCGHS